MVMSTPSVLLFLLLPIADGLPTNLTATTDYPHSGSNSLKAGGGGACVYYYVDHDSTPVVTSAHCTITSKDLDKGDEPSATTQAYARKLGSHDGCDNDDAGHILANRLGGLGTEPTNIMPQTPHLNRGLWKAFEGEVYACIKTGGAQTAKLSWTWQYSSESKTRPKTMTYHATYDKGCTSNKQSFENTCQPTSVNATTA
eukprot:TRINITY_DN3288_c0_g1_i4.p1 TRINITY_DN3288_c0_g1~~TRINITY_DN3288_c0_g1_i4.p1  ORF type:complete len:199 (-),score=44.61 TRINITY_DN3288_c0_g1_i4:346-942(-)